MSNRFWTWNVLIYITTPTLITEVLQTAYSFYRSTDVSWTVRKKYRNKLNPAVAGRRFTDETLIKGHEIKPLFQHVVVGFSDLFLITWTLEPAPDTRITWATRKRYKKKNEIKTIELRTFR